MKTKKKLLKLVSLLLVFVMLVGCGKSGEKDVHIEAVKDENEPTLSEEAEKIPQYAYPVEGDLCADIFILDYGHIYIKLFSDVAPYAVDNFITKARNGEYDGTKMSDAVGGYFVQGGALLDKTKKEESIWGGGFSNEIDANYLPTRGALCMANQGEDGTNAMQFFITTGSNESVQGLTSPLNERYKMSLKDYLASYYDVTLTDGQLDRFLNYGGAPWLSGKNTVFGQVFDGFDVLGEVENAMTSLSENSTIYIKKITIYEHL